MYGRWLYKDNSINAETLVIEGWLPVNALKTGITQFKIGDYNMLVTTGTQMPEEFRMGSLGSLVCDINCLELKQNNQKVSSIKVKARGTKVKEHFPFFNLLVNDSVIGGNYVSQRNEEYEYLTDLNLNQVEVIKIDFINDTFTKWKDRNLFVSSVVIGDIKLPAHCSCMFYDIKNSIDYKEYEPRFMNYADYSAFIIKNLGFRDSIIALPASGKRLSRTYSCALAFKEWYLKSSFKGAPVNIVSLGPHSRRTWMTYRRVLGKNADVGIIMVNNEEYNKNNWWKSLTGVKVTIHEMASYIYTFITLPFLSKELKN